MSKETRIQVTERVGRLLSDRERSAYEYWCKSDQLPISPSLNAKFFALFLQGKGCEEIRRLNPQYSLGQIVSARIEGDWDALRQEHLETLLKETSTRVQQTTFETADLVCDLLAAANREHGDKLKRYLQTGDERELGDLRITGLQGLRSAIEILQKLTGQDKQKTIMLGGELGINTPATTTASVVRKPTSAQAERILKLLSGAK